MAPATTWLQIRVVIPHVILLRSRCVDGCLLATLETRLGASKWLLLWLLSGSLIDAAYAPIVILYFVIFAIGNGLHKQPLGPINLADGTKASQVAMLAQFALGLEGARHASRSCAYLLDVLDIEAEPILVLELHHAALPFGQHLERSSRIVEFASPLHLWKMLQMSFSSLDVPSRLLILLILNTIKRPQPDSYFNVLKLVTFAPIAFHYLRNLHCDYYLKLC